ncbi:MAG: DUF4248 domain-containing protein [Prevotella sp.]|nr:DUF4248 domain-containing protein [Prevotella sp.]
MALIYFPNSLTKSGALNNLNSWIRGNKELCKN